MLDSLCKKMTNSMLWFLVIPLAILILSISSLIGAYISVVVKSDQVAYEGFGGKISAKISNFETEIKAALAVNNKLIKGETKLKKSLDELNMTNSSAHYTDEKPNSPEVSNLIKDIQYQSNLLMEQKRRLESVNEKVLKFKQELKECPKTID